MTPRARREDPLLGEAPRHVTDLRVPASGKNTSRLFDDAQVLRATKLFGVYLVRIFVGFSPPHTRTRAPRHAGEGNKTRAEKKSAKSCRACFFFSARRRANRSSESAKSDDAARRATSPRDRRAKTATRPAIVDIFRM